MNGWSPPALLDLMPEQAEAVPRLAAFEREHPGVTIVTPHYRTDPWRAYIDEGTVPGDGRAMTTHKDKPADLLGELEALFGCG
jgi:hypothetical protein